MTLQKKTKNLLIYDDKMIAIAITHAQILICLNVPLIHIPRTACPTMQAMMMDASNSFIDSTD